MLFQNCTHDTVVLGGEHNLEQSISADHQQLHGHSRDRVTPERNRTSDIVPYVSEGEWKGCVFPPPAGRAVHATLLFPL